MIDWLEVFNWWILQVLGVFNLKKKSFFNKIFPSSFGRNLSLTKNIFIKKLFKILGSIIVWTCYIIVIVDTVCIQMFFESMCHEFIIVFALESEHNATYTFTYLYAYKT